MAQRTWFITGISSGFGREMTHQLLGRGDRVVGTVRKVDAVADLQATHPDRLLVVRLDVTDLRAIKGVVDAAFASVGRIDVIVNNAGYGLFGAAEEVSDEQIADQLNTNLVGPIYVARAALPHLRAQGGGRIIQLSTYGGQVAGAGGSLYHASKWGIEGFMESLMEEVASFNIGVTIVEPGGARTGFRFASSKVGAELDAYKGTPVGAIHAFLKDGSRVANGDPAKMARLMIDSVDHTPAPKRLVFGPDAYNALVKALMARVADVQAQKDFAFSTDLPAGT